MIPDTLGALLLTLLHGVASSLVTAHVLLTHRDVRSAIGWIALAWLSPFIGAAIYLGLGINRVARRATRLSARHNLKSSQRRPLLPASGRKFARNIALIAETGNKISEFPLTAGNKVSFLLNGDAAYPSMLEAIAGAEKSVALASYIFAGDATGARFAEALIAAHKRGVAVRVLIDGVGGGYLGSAAIRQLSEGGVAVDQFLHELLPWQMPFLNLRNHRKFLIVDGKTGFTGGINIADENIEAEGRARTISDLHAKLEGPVVSHMMLTFARDWEFTTGEILEGGEWWPELKPLGKAPMRGITSGPDQDIGRIETMFAAAIERAEKRIRIVTPYFLPEQQIMDGLRRASLRGVAVDVLVPGRGNHFFLDWAMRAHFAMSSVDRINCRLTAEPFDHSKLMTVDGKWCAFGSPNWDARSLRLNFEFMVECYDADVVAALDAIADQKLEGAVRLTADDLRARPLAVKFRDGLARLLLPYI